MIDLQTETVVTFREAAKLIPRRRAGKKCAVSTLHRWRLKGIRGARLETAMVGGIRVTSVEAIQRFVDRLSNDPGRAAQVCTSRTPEMREKELAKVDTALAREGF